MSKATDQELEELVLVPDLKNKDLYVEELNNRRRTRAKFFGSESPVNKDIKRMSDEELAKMKQEIQFAEKLQINKESPPVVGTFDQRTEVSADAEYIAGRIVKHLWIIFIVVPLIFGILWAILSQMK